MADTPKKFLCPLTDSEMITPVVHKTTGIRFEEQAIMEWIESGNNFCPITCEPLEASDLILDVDLQNEIKQHRDSRLLDIRDRLISRRTTKMQKSKQELPTSCIFPLATDLTSRRIAAHSA